MDFALIFSLVIILIIMWPLETAMPKYRGARTKLRDFIFFNGMIRLFIEAFLDLVLFSLLNIVEMEWPKSLDAVSISNFTACAFFFLCIMMPIVLLVHAYRSRNKWQDDSYSRKYGTLLEGTKNKNDSHAKAVIAMPLIFFIRRLALSLTLVFW